ncbi:hypothetical protein DFH09DRAFT_643187 [Mycena vulgaris]|nr:hypothetical protein DFH09DRAFT_643187 [Mycena vulgaris]
MAFKRTSYSLYSPLRLPTVSHSMDAHPLGCAAVFFEKLVIGGDLSSLRFMSMTICFVGLIFAISFVLLVLFSVAVEASEFLVFPLTIEWFTLVVVGIYLLVRESRARSTPPSLPVALVMFGVQFILGLATSLALTIRAWPGSTLCDDFGTIPHGCSIALAVVGMSWVTTTAAFAGILLSCAGPLYRLYRGLCAIPRAKGNPKEHAIELVDMPSHHPSHNGSKDRWTNIPV